MRLPRVPLLFSSLLALAMPLAGTASGEDVVLDQTQLTQLEAKAEHAAMKEQCFLYTELVHSYTAIAGKQLAEGETEKASATLKRVQGFAMHIHTGLARDTSKLKNAEMLLHAASRNLGEYLHHASAEDQEIVASTLKQLDKVNEELLAQVFAH